MKTDQRQTLQGIMNDMEGVELKIGRAHVPAAPYREDAKHTS